MYFCYGYSHSVEAVGPNERSETQLTPVTTPGFGNQVEEYLSASDEIRSKFDRLLLSENTVKSTFSH